MYAWSVDRARQTALPVGANLPAVSRQPLGGDGTFRSGRSASCVALAVSADHHGWNVEGANMRRLEASVDRAHGRAVVRRWRDGTPHQVGSEL